MQGWELESWRLDSGYEDATFWRLMLTQIMGVTDLGTTCNWCPGTQKSIMTCRDSCQDSLFGYSCNLHVCAESFFFVTFPSHKRPCGQSGSRHTHQYQNQMWWEEGGVGSQRRGLVDGGEKEVLMRLGEGTRRRQGQLREDGLSWPSQKEQMIDWINGQTDFFPLWTREGRRKTPIDGG